MAAPQLVTISGTVSRVNDSGFQLREDVGVWRNVTKYPKPGMPAPVLPAVGMEVTCTLDGKGFVCAIEPMGPRAVESVSKKPTTSAPTTSVAPSRDTTITRLALIKAAATFATTRPEMKSTDVMAVAARWEAWVLR